MPLPRPLAVRVIGAVVALATLTTGCGALTSRPELVDAAAPAAPVEVLAFVAPEEADAIPAPRAPELLGLDEARASAAAVSASFDLAQLGGTAQNPLIAAEVRSEQAGFDVDGATGGAADHVAGEDDHGSRGETEAAATLPQAVEATGVAGAGIGPNATSRPENVAPTDATDADVAEADGIALTEGWMPSDAGSDPEARATGGQPRDDAAAAQLVDVPVALPRYGDPTEMFLHASGRAFVSPTPPDGNTGLAPDQAIRVGGLVSQTLAGYPYRPDVCAGAAARFAQANEAQELTRSITFETCNDDAGRVDLAEGLVGSLARDQVFAAVPVASPAFLATDALADRGIPWFGTGDLPAFCGRTNPLGFGTWGAESCPVLEARGYVALNEPVLTAWASTWPEGDAPEVVYALEGGPRGEAVAAARRFEAELIGIAQPAVVAALPTAAQGPPADWASVVEALLDPDPDAVVVEGRAVDGLPAALRNAGFTGEIILVGRIDPLDVANTDARLELAPLTVVSPGLDLATRSGAGWDAMVVAAAEVGVEVAEIGLDFVEGYLAADLFVRAVAMTPEPLSSTALAAAINEGWWYPGVEGLSCGSWWPAAHLARSPCVSISRVEVFNARLVPVLGLVETEPQLRFDLG